MDTLLGEARRERYLHSEMMPALFGRRLERTSRRHGDRMHSHGPLLDFASIGFGRAVRYGHLHAVVELQDVVFIRQLLS